MASNQRTVVVLFAAAVVAALAAVAWLVLGSSPPAETPVPAPAGTTPVPAPGPHRPGPARPGPAPPRPRPAPVSWVLAGTVKGPDGAPVADADVVLFPGGIRDTPQAPAAAAGEDVPPEALREMFSLDPEDVAATRLYSGVPALPEAAAPRKESARGTTGPDGAFRIPVRIRGPFRVEARKEGVGHAVATDVPAADASGPSPGIVLTLGTAATLAGRVVSGTGQPVEGAVVIVRSGGVSRGTTAGADGSFSVRDLSPGRYALDAGAPGFAPVSLPSVEAPSSAPLDVVLGFGYAARVTVTKREIPAQGTPLPRGAAILQGTPLEGALVVLYHRPTRTYRSAVTGPDGTVRIEKLGAGKWLVSARRDGFQVGLGREIHFRVGSPPEEAREVKMFASVPTPVRVLDEAGGPVRGARVYTGGLDVEYDPKHSVLVGRTDEEGRISFAFDDGIPWKGVLWIVPEEGGAVVKVEPDDPTAGEEVRAVVRPGRAIQGTVTDTKGRPVAGAQVLVNVTSDEPEVDVGLYAYTDAKGAYRFPGLPFGAVSLEVDAEGEWDTLDVEEDVKDNPLVRDFILEVEEK